MKKDISINTKSLSNFFLFVFLISISAFRLNIYIALSSFALVTIFSILSNKKIIVSGILKWGILFWGYYLISVVWSPNNSDTLRYLSAIVYALGIYIFLPNIVKTEDDVKTTLKLIFYSIAFTAILILLLTPISSIGSQRMGNIIGLNENTFGTRMAIGALISIYLLKGEYNKKKFHKIFTIIMMIVFGLLVLLSGSKKALILLITGIFLLELLYTKGIKKIFKLIFVLIIVIGLIFVIFNNSKLYGIIGYRLERTYLTITNNNSLNSILVTNNGLMGTTDKSLIERQYYMKTAISLFKSKPIFGHGGNSFISHMRDIGYSHIAYSHNNFTELLCTLGIIGFLIYYSFWFFIILKTINILKSGNENDKQISILFLTIELLLVILDYGCVSYIMEFNMFLLCLFYIYLKIKAKEVINDE